MENCYTNVGWLSHANQPIKIINFKKKLSDETNKNQRNLIKIYIKIQSKYHWILLHVENHIFIDFDHFKLYSILSYNHR